MEYIKVESKITKAKAVDVIRNTLNRFENLFVYYNENKNSLAHLTVLAEIAKKLEEKKFSKSLNKFIYDDKINSLSANTCRSFLLKLKPLADKFMLYVSIPADVTVYDMSEEELRNKYANVKINTIKQDFSNGKVFYVINYDRTVSGIDFYNGSKKAKESKTTNSSLDLYRNFAEALGIENQISNEDLKKAMLDNKYHFIDNIGWVTQEEYIAHQEGIKESNDLTANQYPFGLYNGLKNSITSQNTDFITNLSTDKASENVKNKWKALIEKSNDLKNFELKVIYKESDRKLRVYYRIKNDDASKIEILSIDALSKVMNRACPVGNDFELAPNKAKSVCKTSPNGKFYVPQKFPKTSSGNPWHITSIEDLNAYDDPEFIGPKKIRTDAYINVNIWKFSKENEEDDDNEKKWIKTSEKDKDEGYLIHGGDGSSQNKDKYNKIDKQKGNNRYNTNTQGCIRINNRDVYLLVDLFTGNLPIELEVF